MAIVTVNSVKCLLSCMNFVTMICGLAVLGVGIWAKLDRNFLESLVGTYLYSVTAYMLMAAGAAIALVSLLGCCGARREMKFLLILYAFITFILFLGMVIAAIMAYIYSSEVRRKMPEMMRKSIPLYGKRKDITEAWDMAQTYLKCCGMKVEVNESYEIWQKNEMFQKGNGTVVPDSCCVKRDLDSIKACNQDPKRLTFNKDCYHQAEMYVKDNAMILGAIGFSTACIVIIGLVLSCLLIVLL